MTIEEVTLCEAIRRLGYAQNARIRLYGETFDLISDPIIAGENLIFVDVFEQRSGRRRRVRVPLNVVHMARSGRGAMFRGHRKAA